MDSQYLYVPYNQISHIYHKAFFFSCKTCRKQSYLCRQMNLITIINSMSPPIGEISHAKFLQGTSTFVC